MTKLNYGGTEVEQKIADILGVSLEDLDKAYGFVRVKPTMPPTSNVIIHTAEKPKK
jgi:hypothetical protein